VEVAIPRHRPGEEERNARVGVERPIDQDRLPGGHDVGAGAGDVGIAVAPALAADDRLTIQSFVYIELQRAAVEDARDVVPLVFRDRIGRAVRLQPREAGYLGVGRMADDAEHKHPLLHQQIRR
jgi:hypothetical protein